MNIKTVEDLFIHLLSDTYSAEKQLARLFLNLPEPRPMKN